MWSRLERIKLKFNLPLIVVILFFFFYFFDILFLRGMFFSSDLRSNEFQLRVYLGRTLHQGKFPLWAPELFCGYPLLGDYMAGLYYPISLIFFYLLPDIAAFNYFILVHYLLIMIFVYYYARLIGISNWGAMLSSLVFTFGGHTIVRTAQSTHLVALTAFPMVLTLLELYYQKKKRLFFILAAVINAISIFNGHPKIIGFTTIFALIYLVIREGSVKHIRTISYWKQAGLNILIFLSITMGISAIQMIPFFEQQQFSYRAGGDTYENATSGSFPWSRLITLIYPYYFGGPYASPELSSIFVETSIYMGIVSLFLILIALILRKQEFYTKIYIYTLIISFILALGNNTPLYRLVYPIPFFSHSRVPSKILFITSFAGAILAGIGFDSISTFLTKLRNTNLARTIFRESIIIGIPMLIIFGLAITHTYRLEQFSSGILGTDFLYAHIIWQTGLVFITIILILVWITQRKLSLNLLKSLFIGLLFIDLFWFSSILKQDLNKAIPRELSLQPPAVVAIIKQDKSELYRVYSFSNQLYEGYDDIHDSISLLTRFSGLYYGIPTFHLYGPAKILRYYEYLGEIEAPWIKMAESQRTEMLYKKLPLLSAANVKYIITKIPLSHPNLELVNKGGIKVYRLKSFLPQTYFVPNGVALNDKQDILTYLNRPEFNPAEVVILEKYPNSTYLQRINNQSVNNATIRIIDQSHHKIILETTSTDSGFLVLSQYYYPGWQAKLDNAKVPIYQANYLFRAIELPSGTHRVTFLFRPKSFLIGCGISVVTVIVLIVYFFFLFYRQRNISSTTPFLH